MRAFIVVLISLVCLAAYAAQPEKPAPMQSYNCYCYAEGRSDAYGNFPYGEGYHNTIRGACAAAVNSCVSAAPHPAYLPCVAVRWGCN